LDSKKAVVVLMQYVLYVKLLSSLLLAAVQSIYVPLIFSKAFDKVKHHALLMKLKIKHIPNKLLSALENWLDNCYMCVH